MANMQSLEKLPTGLAVVSSSRPPETDWRRMTNMRNLLIHEFHNIDYDIVWRTVQGRLRPLITSIHRLRDGLC